MSKKTLFIIIGILVTSVAIFLVQRSIDTPYELLTVQKGDIFQEVSASGKVESPTTIDLHFKNSGKLVILNAKIGDEIHAGQLLAKQGTAQLDAQVFEMQAGIDIQKAKLVQLQSGVAPEDIAIAETTMMNAEVSVANAQQSLKNVINDLENEKNKADVDLENVYGDVKDIISSAVIKNEDAINKQTDEMFINDSSAYPKLTFITVDSQAGTDSEWKRVTAGNELVENKNELSNLGSEYSVLDDALTKTKNHLSVSEGFIIKLSDAVQGAVGLSQSTVSTYKTNLNVGRSNINAAIASINNQKQLIVAQKITNQKNIDSAQKNIDSAENALKTAEGNVRIFQNQLALKKAPARSSDIALYQAQIRQAEAQKQKIQAQREDLIISAPSSGLVTAVNGEVGETVGPDKSIVSFAAGGAFQITLNVVEDSVANIKIGQEVRIAFDAIEKQEFSGKVVAIDPAGTVVGGAVYFRTTILFDKNDERVRSGMTANVWIKTMVSEKTLLVPVSTIKTEGDKKIVRVLEQKELMKKEVVTGIKNNSGMIEIISGLSEGDQVIIDSLK